MISYEEFVRFLEGEYDGYNSWWKRVSPQVNEFMKQHPQEITNPAETGKAIKSALFNDIKAGKFQGKPEDNAESLQQWATNKCQEVLKQAGSKNNTSATRSGETSPQEGSAMQEVSPESGQSQPARFNAKFYQDLYKKYAQTQLNDYINDPSNRIESSERENFIKKFNDLFNQHIDKDYPQVPREVQLANSKYETLSPEDQQTLKSINNVALQNLKDEYAEAGKNFQEGLQMWVTKTLGSINSNDQAEPGQPTANNNLKKNIFSKITPAEINEIGREESTQKAENIKKYFTEASSTSSNGKVKLGDGIQKIEFLQEERKTTPEKSSESENPITPVEKKISPQTSGAPSNNGDSSGEVKQEALTSKLKTYRMLREAEGEKVDEEAAKVDLPQTLTFRVYFTSDTMYWVCKTYGQIDAAFSVVERAEEYLKKAEEEKGEEEKEKEEEKEETKEGDSNNSEVEKDLKPQVEQGVSSEKSTDSGEEDTTTKVKESIKAAERYLRSLREEEESQEENPEGLESEKEEGSEASDAESEGSEESEKIEISGDSSASEEERPNYYLALQNSIDYVEGMIVKDLIDSRKTRIAKLPPEQQRYYPTFEAIPSTGERKDILNEKLQKELDNINGVAKGEAEKGITLGDKEALAEKTKVLAPLKAELIQLTKDPNNCYVDLRVNMVGSDSGLGTTIGAKAKQALNSVGKGLMGVSKSTQKWSKVFSGR